MSDETGSSNSPSTSDISIFPQIQREDIELGGQLGVGSFGAGSFLFYLHSWLLSIVVDHQVVRRDVGNNLSQGRASRKDCKFTLKLVCYCILRTEEWKLN